MIKKQWIKDIRKTAPRIHCITNYVTARDVANMILSLGASPIMAQGKQEAEEVSSICQALVLNMGTLEEWTTEAMLLAGKRAAALKHPIILDPVGITASAFRKKEILKVQREVNPSIIRGNEAEILAFKQALQGEKISTVCGVDSTSTEQEDKRAETVKTLSKLTKAVVIMTGKEDLVADQTHLCRIKNGHPFMGRITGSGCMLDGILGVFSAAAEPASALSAYHEQEAGLWKAAIMAVCAHGLCGELAYKKTIKQQGGLGSFSMYMVDYMSELDDEMLKRGMKIEI